MNLAKVVEVPKLLYQLKTMPPYSPQGLANFAMRSRILNPLQIPSELRALAVLVGELQPKYVLEIGTCFGGTLFVLARLSAPDATIVSVDLPGGKFGGGYQTWRGLIYRRFPTNGQQLHLLRADSHHLDTLLKVRQLLHGHALDLLFIDGDHTYQGVKADFEQYAPLVREGGMVLLHDIAEHAIKKDCKVSEFWREIRMDYRHQEIVENPFQGWAGIGVLRV